MADDDLIEALKALAHPLRWHILATLAAGERNVGEIESASGITQPGLSQQLGVLRKAGLVSTRKDAKLVFYSIADDQVQMVTAALSALAPHDPPLPAANDTARISAPGVANFARMS
ncbi:ArsR/SmtB family transcription factor [Porphyrobacter sp. AAP60]|uniref:ArsR/SmtB family transcription factor n=1 Tax=Porphyrobacter sp. AAP60 TaxID=1523423 RepID=UPI0006B90C54|nr:metalloregulator ArsR/SmtB family transcription factor [Porphyrobacter sp. AAP60]KPF64371.1 ArsR family transcriptional regulator [Porphyrobacter sp. AAP60]